MQWDPERNLRGAALDYYSIQVGISRHLIQELVEKWTLKIEDLTPKVAKMSDLLRRGKIDDAKRHLPTGGFILFRVRLVGGYSWTCKLVVDMKARREYHCFWHSFP